MIQPEDHVCPLCGLVLTPWHAFHQHVAKMHEKKEKDQSDTAKPYTSDI